MLQLLVPVAHAFFVPAFRPASPCPAAVMTVAAPAVSEGTITLTPEQVSAFGRPAVRLLTDAADATSAAENADVYSEEEDLALAMACMRMAAKEVEIESLRSRLESFAKPSGTMYSIVKSDLAVAERVLEGMKKMTDPDLCVLPPPGSFPIKTAGATTSQGIFAPLVLGAKSVMGAQELKEFRASVIAKHSKVIAEFVDTSASPFGQLVLKSMFEYADKDGNGTLDRQEVREALQDLGFDFLDEKQVGTIVKKADKDKDEVIDFEEFVKETPKVLRVNLVKLAKRNGHDLGFLV